ncbi:MAG TPA: CHASE3 domain-containing protein [Bryobacteraceae bacterium]|nr:CHASE3 domain-containing protein [Bryobacteraceae bacterium]
MRFPYSEEPALRPTAPASSKRIHAGFLAAALLLLGMFWALNQSGSQLAETSRRIANAQDILKCLETTVGTASRAETLARGYLITGQTQYLELLHRTDLRLNDEIERLGRLVVDNPRQQSRVAAIRSLLEGQLNSSRHLIEVRERQGLTAASQALASSHSQQRLDQMRALAAEISNEERDALERRAPRWNMTQERLAAYLGISAALALALHFVVYLLFVRDARHRASLETELFRKNKALEKANRLKSEFLANLSHELRTPLNAIIGFTGTLLMRLPGPLNADQEKQLTTVQNSGKHLLGLIDDLLDLAKIDAGKVKVGLEDITCREIIEEVIRQQLPTAGEKALPLKAVIPQQRVLVTTDRRALGQILNNLVSNAIKYTERGLVQVELEERQEAGQALAAIHVVDTGTGIKPEEQASIFHAFEQMRPGRREGRGLGLNLSHKLAELIGAVIEFESEYGKGSRFTVLVPKARRGAEECNAAPACKARHFTQSAPSS